MNQNQNKDQHVRKREENSGKVHSDQQEDGRKIGEVLFGFGEKELSEGFEAICRKGNFYKKIFIGTETRPSEPGLPGR